MTTVLVQLLMNAYEICFSQDILNDNAYFMISQKILKLNFKSSCLKIFFKINVLKFFCNIYRKTPVLELLFNKVTGLEVCCFIKKRLQHRYFLVNIAKCLRTPILKNICKCCFGSCNHKVSNKYWASHLNDFDRFSQVDVPYLMSILMICN